MDLRKIAASLTLDEVANLLAQVNALTHRVDEQDRQLNWYRTQLFGARSERRLLEACAQADQLWLGQQMLDVPEDPPPKGETVRSYERKHRRVPEALVESDSRLRFDATVPVEVIDVTNPAVDGLTESAYTIIGEKVTYRLAQRSAYVVLKYVQKTVKIAASGEIARGSAPPAVFERSFADVSFLAGLAVDKFCHHLPLYRQHKRLEQAGVTIDRATLTRLVRRSAELLEPVYYALLSSIRLSSVLTMDESPTPAGVAAGSGGKPGRMRRGYFWALYGDKDEVGFLFAPTRARHVIDEALSGFEGTLLTDGYKAYQSFVEGRTNVAHGQCWAHTRRKFVESEPLQPQAAARILRLVLRLYKVEDTYKDAPDEERLRARQSLSKPIVDDLFEALREQRDRALLLPSSPFTQAIGYALERERQLRLFLDDPRVQIDTNHIERTLRGPAVGRKNWMFHVTEVGARHAAIYYSLIKTCEIHGVNPEVYLIDVLQRIDTHLADEVELLTPRLWKEHFGTQPLRSDVFGRP